MWTYFLDAHFIFCVVSVCIIVFWFFTTQQMILWSLFSNLLRFPRSVKMINFVFRCRFSNFQNKQNIKLYRTGTTSNYWCIVCSLVSFGILNKQKLDHLEQQLFHGNLNENQPYFLISEIYPFVNSMYWFHKYHLVTIIVMNLVLMTNTELFLRTK